MFAPFGLCAFHRALWQSESDVGISHFFRTSNCTVARETSTCCCYDDELTAVNLIRRWGCIATPRKLARPQLLARLVVESSDFVVSGATAENEPAGRDQRTTEIRGAGLRNSLFCEFFVSMNLRQTQVFRPRQANGSIFKLALTATERIAEEKEWRPPCGV